MFESRALIYRSLQAVIQNFLSNLQVNVIVESEDSENSSASGNKMETQQIFSSKSRIDRSRMRTRVGISPPVPFKYGYPSPDKNEPLYMADKIEQV